MAANDMKVLQFHTPYLHPGGEDACVASEAELLGSRGIEVRQSLRPNAAVLERGTAAVIAGLWRAAFNRHVYEETRALCRELAPDVAHVHNFWFAASPAIHAACRAEGVPTVQTLHNFRLLCAAATLMRDGRPCQDCLGGSLWPGIVHGCYRRSRLQSYAVARMVHAGRRRETWTRDVTAYVALTGRCREIFVEGGLPAERIEVKPNFVADPGSTASPGNGAVFVGRLSGEKGVMTLIRAWRTLPQIPLEIVGDGPMRTAIEREIETHDLRNVALRGQIPVDEVHERIRAAAFTVMPSEWHEGLPRALIEAFASGRTVIASRIGALEELIDDGRTGRLVTPGSPDELAEQVRWMAADSDRPREMGLAARREYEERYTPARNFDMLISIYEGAIRRGRDGEGNDRR